MIGAIAGANAIDDDEALHLGKPSFAATIATGHKAPRAQGKDHGARALGLALEQMCRLEREFADADTKYVSRSPGTGGQAIHHLQLKCNLLKS